MTNTPIRMVVNVTGHVVSSRLISGQIAIAVETVAVPGGAELTIPPIVGRNAFSIEVSDESPCPGDDPSGSFLFTTDNPVVRSLDFDAGTSFAGTDTVTGEEGPAVASAQMPIAMCPGRGNDQI